ncbi:hypothetical protein [Cytobacillus sp. IB215316]|uniref:hypothetical protein n=1 Tax=Cytobacillus sp. IB215316 TaxID=3097354 RepID=UPI002A12C0E3|nr:hypothetical protein [Cytobacillus sp. IB215316]MDX8362633.1 hypothetical protein [Cytobacillus sp. IB215316]
MRWNERLFNRKSDFIVVIESFAKWKIVQNAWLQVAEGQPPIGNGFLSVGIENMELERECLIEELSTKIKALFVNFVIIVTKLAP